MSGLTRTWGVSRPHPPRWRFLQRAALLSRFACRSARHAGGGRRSGHRGHSLRTLARRYGGRRRQSGDGGVRGGRRPVRRMGGGDTVAFALADITGLSPSAASGWMQSLLFLFVLWGIRQLVLLGVRRQVQDVRALYRWRKTSSYVAVVVGAIGLFGIWLGTGTVGSLATLPRAADGGRRDCAARSAGQPGRVDVHSLAQAVRARRPRSHPPARGRRDRPAAVSVHALGGGHGDRSGTVHRAAHPHPQRLGLLRLAHQPHQRVCLRLA